MNSGAPKRLAVPVLHVTPVVLLLNGTNIIWYENHVGNHDTNGRRDEYIFYPTFYLFIRSQMMINWFQYKLKNGERYIYIWQLTNQRAWNTKLFGLETISKTQCIFITDPQRAIRCSFNLYGWVKFRCFKHKRWISWNW